MPTQIQLRRGTSSEWTAANPVLGEGELGLETDTKLYKIGDGTSSWNQLNYRQLSESLGTAIFEGQESEVEPPPEDNLAFYTRSVGGRMMPRFRGPSGLDSALQPAFFGNGVYMASPGTSSAMNVMGGPTLTNVGSMSHPPLNSSSLRQQMSRARVLSAATANAAAESRVAFARVWRGDSPGYGGFFVRIRFSIVSEVATQRVFVGLTSSTGAISTTQDPTLLTQCVGIGAGADDGNLQLLHNDAAGPAIKTDLGSKFPRLGVDDIYDLTLFAPPNSQTLNWRIERIADPAVEQGVITGELPNQSTFLAPHIYINNGGTAEAVEFNISRLYMESDY